jgi:formylglycine-generating enzyme required for sulfatase activity
MEGKELIEQAVTYYKNKFGHDLSNMLSKCETNITDGFPFVLHARDLSHEKLSDTFEHEIFFLAFWCYSHAIVHQIGLSQSNKKSWYDGYDLVKNFCKLTGYPMFSLGLGGVMSAKQNMYEFSASKKLSPDEREFLKEVASGVSSYIVKELKLFLEGEQPELIHSKEYQDFVIKINDKKDSICEAVVEEVKEAVNCNTITRYDNKIEIMIDYPLGKFNMIKVERGDGSSYYIGETTVTIKIWNYFAKTHRFVDSQNPVTDIDKEDIDDFFKELSNITGLNFRLPTVEEWVWAAKGGLKSKGYKYIGSDDVNEIAWWRGNSDNMLHAVAQKKPNELGLYDMAGNVWELTSDTKEEALLLLQLQNPDAKAVTRKVYVDCGGCFYDKQDHLIPNCKGSAYEHPKSSILGFRIVCD